MELKLPPSLTWIVHYARLIEVADKLAAVVGEAFQPASDRQRTAGALSDVVQQAHVAVLALPVPRDAFEAAQVSLEAWLGGSTDATGNLQSALTQVETTLRSEAGLLIGGRFDPERRHALLYGLNVLCETRRRLQILESNMRRDLCAPTKDIKDWLSWAKKQAYVTQVTLNDSGPAFRLTEKGNDHLKATLSADANLKMATLSSDSKLKSLLPSRDREQKGGILDAQHLFKVDLKEKTREVSRAFDLCVLYIDIDHFKKVNELFLEVNVDKSFLPAVMELIRRSAVGHGYAYREGGEEFVVLLTTAGENQAKGFADDLLTKIREVRFSLDFAPSPPTEEFKRAFKVVGQTFRVTASIGIASLSRWSIDAIHEAANQAKQTAKKDGRDRVVVAVPPPPQQQAKTEKSAGGGHAANPSSRQTKPDPSGRVAATPQPRRERAKSSKAAVIAILSFVVVGMGAGLLLHHVCSGGPSPTQPTAVQSDASTPQAPEAIEKAAGKFESQDGTQTSACWGALVISNDVVLTAATCAKPNEKLHFVTVRDRVPVDEMAELLTTHYSTGKIAVALLEKPLENTEALTLGSGPQANDTGFLYSPELPTRFEHRRVRHVAESNSEFTVIPHPPGAIPPSMAFKPGMPFIKEIEARWWLLGVGLEHDHHQMKTTLGMVASLKSEIEHVVSLWRARRDQIPSDASMVDVNPVDPSPPIKPRDAGEDANPVPEAGAPKPPVTPKPPPPPLPSGPSVAATPPR